MVQEFGFDKIFSGQIQLGLINVNGMLLVPFIIHIHTRLEQM
jgi:hypothetical protein